MIRFRSRSQTNTGRNMGAGRDIGASRVQVRIQRRNMSNLGYRNIVIIIKKKKKLHATIQP